MKMRQITYTCIYIFYIACIQMTLISTCNCNFLNARKPGRSGYCHCSYCQRTNSPTNSEVFFKSISLFAVDILHHNSNADNNLSVSL